MESSESGAGRPARVRVTDGGGVMSEEAGFLKALAEEPNDESTRLAFADWLTERDDPRAPWARDADLFRFATPALADPLPRLIAALGRKKTHDVVLRGLVKLGERAVPPLLERMRGGDAEVRSHAR